MEIEGWTFILWAMLLLTLPLNWLLAAILGAVWHELCHALAVLLCGGRILSMTVEPGGIRMDTGPLSRGKSVLCSLAGPLGSLLLLPLAPWFPRLALCGLGQGTFNLLPIYPLDGGRALESLFPPWRKTRMALLLLLLWGSIFLGLGPVPVLAVALAGGNNPCKSRRFRVQ